MIGKSVVAVLIQNEYKESGVNTVNGCVPTVNCKGVLKIKVYFARIRRPHRKNSV